MNYLKMYEDFEEDYQGLPSEQEEDLFEIFHELIDRKYNVTMTDYVSEISQVM